MTTLKPTLAAVALGKALEGVRALLLDLDGVIVVAGEAVSAAPEAIATLEARGFPYRIVTNTSAVSRATLARWSGKIGAPIPASRFQSALSASAAWTARQFPGAPLYVLASEDAQGEFAGQRLLTHEEAGARGATAAAVVIGDSPEEVTFDNMNRAFRLVRNGAILVGMHQNPWWLTPEGPTLDSGAFVAGLEFATETRARIIGKPHPEFFSVAITDLRREVGRDLARAISRWSATTSAPTSAPRNASACAASSCCPASTRRRTSRSPRRSVAAENPTPSRMISRPSSRPFRST